MPLGVGDRLAIHELIALHGHLVDGGRLDRLGDVFTEDVRYDLSAFGAGVTIGLDAIRAAADALGSRNPLAHLVTNTVVVEEDDDEVRVDSKYLGLSTDGSVGSGTYEDLVLRTSAGWRVAERRVVPRRAPLTP